MNEVELGHAIQMARKQTGLTQQELCQKTGISYSTLAKIERGAIKSPSVFTVISIASVCNTSVEKLAGKAELVAGADSSRDLKRAKSGVEFVYFDVNGCMVRYFQTAFARISADTGASLESVEAAFWQYNDSVCRGDLSIGDFNKHFAMRIGADSLDWGSYYLDAVQPIKETQEELIRSQQSFRVGLLTNIMPGQIESLFDKGYLPKISYDAVVDSSKVGSIKPEEHIFMLATEKAGVGPNNILLVDDSRANLMAAERMGWQTIWFDDFRPKESIVRLREMLEI